MSPAATTALALIAGHSLRAAALVAALMLAGAVALALLMRRRPALFPVLAVAAVPFRVPISAEGRTVNLLLPLYTVVAAGVLAHLLPRLLGRREAPAYRSGRRAILLDWLLLGSVGLYALQISYSQDPSKGAQNLLFFYLPFLLLYLLLREAPWTPRLVLVCGGVAVGLAVLFAGVGFVEYANKSLLLNPKVVAANSFDNYFRVNSVFFDPSIYGRFLALAMTIVATAVLWARRRREVLIGAALLAWLWAGLITSFSQSSIAALLLGLAVLAAWRWDVRATVYVCAAAAIIALAVVLAAPPSLHLGLTGSGGSANNATSGRAKLVSGGLELFADRPLQGFGAGSFSTEYLRHNEVSATSAASASHTIPITVAAEQGIFGLLLYVALLFAALMTLFGGAGRSPPRIALAACFAALVLHTFVYADFLEDPVTWTLLGIGVALVPLADPDAARERLASFWRGRGRGREAERTPVASG
jgi:O-antigen ligase